MIKAMNITEKSKEYAEGKAIDAISAAIEQAYADGYKDGYNEGLSSRDNFSSNEVEDGVEYADLGLPSGTKWAIDFLRDDKGKVKFLLYEEARNLNLPTSQQFRELVEYTRRGGYYSDNKGGKLIKITGANGNIIYWKKLGATIAIYSPSNYSYMFWLKDLSGKGSERNAAKDSKIENTFIGYKLPIILVR